MIIFDIDGTLSLVGDRVKYLTRTPKNWDAFYNACGRDKPNIPVMELYYCLSRNNDIVLVTGRRESCRGATVKWLEKQDVWPYALFMRSDGDHRHDTIVKPELVANFIDEIDVVFEDRSSMVKKWRELGIPCMQVAEGDF